MIKGVGFALRKLGIEMVRFDINPEIREYISEVLETEKYYVAGYIGNTSSKQNDKVTMQIFTEEKILGYIKITKEDEVIKSFINEFDALVFLAEKEIKGIPEILGVTEFNGMHMFVQSTQKKLSDKVKNELSEKQINCIKDIVDKTKISCKYETTEFFDIIRYLKKFVREKYPEKERRIMRHSIKIIEKELQDKTGEYAFSHGDFTPDNVYYTEKGVSLCDFEYCKYTMPCYIDIFHYFTQLSLFGLQNDADKTVYLYEKYYKLFEKYVENPDFTYLCYILTIMCFYNKRTTEKFDIYAHKYGEWIRLISYLNSKLD